MNAYKDVSNGSSIDEAKPHQLIQMLLGGALARVATAKGHSMRGEYAAKGDQIGKALSIITGLTTSLNNEAGPLSQNLQDLYDYISRRLLQANMTDDAEIFDEITALLNEVKSGWDLIGDVDDSQTLVDEPFQVIHE